MNPAPEEQHATRRVRIISGRFGSRRRKVTEPLKRGVYLVPATITSLGLLAGFYSLIASINSHFELAAVMIAVAFICDGLDGRVARASRTSSQFGVEYDSLSDVVAFGVAPAGLIYSWALRSLSSVGWVVAGMFVVCGALRLARFNVQAASVDKRRFVGLPVPGAAGMVASTVIAASYFEMDLGRLLPVIAVPLTLSLAGLMISRVPYPSFKGINLHQRTPFEFMVAVLVALSFVIVLPQLTAFILSAAYVLSGPFLLLKGEHLAGKVSVLQPVAAASKSVGARVTGALGPQPRGGIAP